MGNKPSMPSYDRNAAQQEQIWSAEMARKYGNVNVQSPTGGYTWQTDPITGQQTVVVNQAPTDEMRQAFGTSALQSYSPTAITDAYSSVKDFELDPTAAADAYYNASTRYLKDDYETQRNKMSSSLIAKGVPVGSAAYNDAMKELDDSYNKALQTAADTAVMQGQQYQTNALQNELAKASSLSGATAQNISLANALIQNQYNPLSNMVSGTGGAFGGTYDAQFAGQTAAAQAANDRRNAWLNAGGSLLGKVGSAIIGAI